jgi:hypothetical protein
MKTKPHFLAAVSVASIHLAVFAVEPNPLTVPLATEKPLYLNTDASVDQRVADLVSRLTLEEIGASSTDIRATAGLQVATVGVGEKCPPIASVK